ncbi:MAG: hypothetical protein GY820_14525 [Gammaproteobacteria bacterium]|nr:hypothetical protein [Gammaproteobacteria bacterium]
MKKLDHETANEEVLLEEEAMPTTKKVQLRGYNLRHQQATRCRKSHLTTRVASDVRTVVGLDKKESKQPLPLEADYL